MDNNNTVFVNVPVERYEELIVNETKAKALLTVIFGTAKYNKWYPERLALDEEAICSALHAVVPERYINNLVRLAKEPDPSETAEV